MRRAAWIGAIILVLTAWTPRSEAQQPASGGPEAPRRFFVAPGYYGMAYGTPSYGYPRTYSEYSSSFAGGYGAGYAPYGILPGPFGVALWRPGFSAPGYVYGASYYYTFSYPPTPPPPLPPSAPTRRRWGQAPTFRASQAARGV